MGPCWTPYSACTCPARPASCLRPGCGLCQRRIPAAWPDGQPLHSITPRNGMFFKLFTLQLFLLFKSVPKIAWSGAFWFASPRSEAVGSVPSARALGGGQLRQKARLLCNASRCLYFESQVNAGLVPPSYFLFRVPGRRQHEDAEVSLCIDRFSLNLFTTTVQLSLGLHLANTPGPRQEPAVLRTVLGAQSTMVARFTDGETEAERCSGVGKAWKPPSLARGGMKYHASGTPKGRAAGLPISPQSQVASGCLLCPFLRAVSWARGFRREPSRVWGAP